MKHILILEDDEIYRKMLVEKLKKYGRVFEADTLKTALEIYQAGHLDFAFVDLDLEKNLEGLEFLENAQGLSAVVLSSHEEESIIGRAFELGALEFLNKWNFDDYLQDIVEELFKGSPKKPSYNYETNNLKLSKDIERAITLFERTSQTLLITGETGVGKGKLVKSLKREGPFVHANLSEFGSGTLESELFGHTKGAFTGATQDKEGLLKKADGGILFLDEIGTLSLSLQQKLLRVLEEQEFYPVGSNKAERSNFRLITATCDDLKELITEKKFRKDFFFRISGIKLEISPLRERMEDILLTLKAFNKSSPRKVFFTDESRNLLLSHKWKGNYRELNSSLSKMAVVSRGAIKPELVREYLSKEDNDENNFFTEGMQNYIEQYGLRELIQQIEQSSVEWALDKKFGRLNESIRLLDISKSLFYRIRNEAKSAS